MYGDAEGEKKHRRGRKGWRVGRKDEVGDDSVRSEGRWRGGDIKGEKQMDLSHQFEGWGVINAKIVWGALSFENAGEWWEDDPCVTVTLTACVHRMGRMSK